MPHRLRFHRRRGFRLPDNALRVARPSRFSNPFRVAQMPGKEYYLVFLPHSYEGTLAHRILRSRQYSHLTQREAHALAVECYRELLERRPLPGRDLEALRGKDLACYCPLDLPCHADVLLELANR
ncbi:MAG: DUF4326 domain-containing protein [Schleiferiaceae bacterium]|nr:DUF4326 domain-containing protein [Schleiferiaceae bacterium]